MHIQSSNFISENFIDVVNSNEEYMFISAYGWLACESLGGINVQDVQWEEIVIE